MYLLFVGEAAGPPQGGRRQVGVLRSGMQLMQVMLVLVLMVTGQGAARGVTLAGGVTPFRQRGVAWGRFVDHAGGTNTFRFAAWRR